MKLWFAFLVLLVACTTPAPIPGDAAVRDAEASLSASVEPPHVDVPPTPMPDWLVHPRPSLGWPEHDAPPVRAPLRKQPVLAAAGTRPPIIPPSWTVPAWFIDPANSTGAASDNNTCTTSGAPCLTYAELAARWGTYSPRLRQTVTITFSSNQSGNADPVYWSPYLENAAVGIIQGVLGAAQTITTGTLASVTAKNRATPQLLQADLGSASVVANQLVKNTTHSSFAWTYRNVAGTTWSISQPIVPSATPPASFPTNGNEVDTWANLDAFTVFEPVQVNLADIEPRLIDGGANGAVYLYNLTALDPSGTPNTENLYVNNAVRFWESKCQRGIMLTTPSQLPAGNVNYGSRNVAHLGFTTGGSNNSRFRLSGGTIRSNNGLWPFTDIEQDIILEQTIAFTGMQTSSNIYVESAGVMQLEPGGTGNLINGAIWGPGALAVQGATRACYATSGAAAFLLTGTISFNNQTTACSHSGANNPDVINCGITITAAHLDAAQGLAGFGGNAFNPGGASLVLNCTGL